MTPTAVRAQVDSITSDSRCSALTLCAAVLGFFVITLDATIVNVALPSIRSSLGGGMTGLEWIVDAYTLTFAALLLSSGSLTDRIGAKSEVSVKPLFAPTLHTTTGVGQVTFSPFARSAWHTHPAGQTLIVTAGTGWVQDWGKRKQQIQPGDVIWTPPGVKHWQGATDSTTLTHIAIQDTVDGRNVDWMEHVSDDEYFA